MATARIHQVAFNASSQAQEVLAMVPDPGPDGSVEMVESQPATALASQARALDAATSRDLVAEWAVLGGNPAPLARPTLPSRVLGPFRIPARGYLKLDLRTRVRIAPAATGLQHLSISGGSWPEPPLATNALAFDFDARWSGHLYSPTHSLRESPASSGRILVEPSAAPLDPTGPIVLLWPGEPGRPGATHGLLAGRRSLLVVVPGEPAQPASKRRRTWVVAVDTAGSRHGPPLQRAVELVDRILRRLRPEDSFDLVAFSLDPHPMHRFPVAATPENREAALAFLRRQRPWGAPNFEAGLLSSLEIADEAPPDSDAALILVTDGRPTLGEASVRRILEQHQGRQVPILPVAEGPDVDFYFLELLARETAGAALFVDSSHPRLVEDLEALARPLPQEPIRVRLGDRELKLSGDRRVSGPRVATALVDHEEHAVADPGIPRLTVDGEELDPAGSPGLGVLPNLIHEWRELGASIQRALLGESRFPGGHWSFRLLGIVPGTPRPSILATLRDGVGPLGRSRVLALSGILQQGSFQPVPPAPGSAWSGNRFFEADADGRWVESGAERVAARRIGYGSPEHRRLAADPLLAPHLALGRTVTLLTAPGSAIRIGPGENP